MTEEHAEQLLVILKSISESLYILVDAVEQVADRAGSDEEG